MSLTISEVRDDLLGYLGVEEAEQVATSVRRRITGDINGALQEIYTAGPSYLREKSFAVALNKPRSVTGKTFTQGAASMSGGDAIADDMIGCTFRIDGEENDNEIVDSTTLQNPFLGTTTSQGSGTAYNDCVVFDENVASITGPVWLNDKYKLKPISGRASLLDMISSNQMETGQPRFYWVEPYHSQLRLRVYPMPDKAYMLSYDAQLKAPQLTMNDIWGSAPPPSDYNILGEALAGLSLLLEGSISAADTVLQAFGRLGNRVNTLWARTITAGTGLIGGGDFSADRTLSVSFGSSAGTSCEGDDSRLFDARTPTAHNHAASDVNSGVFNVDRLPEMVGADGSNPGTKGVVPAPTTTDNTKFLRGDKTWQSISGGGDMLSSNNLSDVVSATAAFSNIKQAATTTSTGAVELATDGENAANVVVQGNDSRLSDARTPTAHNHTLSEITDSGTAAALDVPASGDAASDEVVKGNDSRLSDSRTPATHASAHTNGTDDIQDATSGQKGLMTAAYASKLDGIEAGANNFTHPDPHLLGNGSKTAPTYSFTDNTDTGIFKDGAERVCVSIDDSTKIAVGSSTTDLITVAQPGTTLVYGLGQSSRVFKNLFVQGVFEPPGSTITLTADDQVLDNRNKGYIRLDSDNATAANRDFKLRQAASAGLELKLEFVSASNACRLEDGAACRNNGDTADAGNVRLKGGDWLPEQYGTLTLKFNGTDWVEIARTPVNQGPTSQVFTSGFGTYTTPVNCKGIKVRYVGGGGGSGSDTNAGSNGGNTSFNSIVANGGSASVASGTNSNGGAGGTGGSGSATVRIPGQPGGNGGGVGTTFTNAGGGGASMLGMGVWEFLTGAGGGVAGIDGNNYGGGAGGIAGDLSSFGASGGGGGGEYVELLISSPAASYSYSIGAGGSGGAAGSVAGGDGAGGIIIVDEFY